MKFLTVILMTLLFGSAVSQDQNELIEGAWNIVAKESNAEKQTFENSKKLKKHRVGFLFQPDGTVIRRVNASGCIVKGKRRQYRSFLTNVEGTWKWTSNGEIMVEYETLMGEHREVLKLENGRLFKNKTAYNTSYTPCPRKPAARHFRESMPVPRHGA